MRRISRHESNSICGTRFGTLWGVFVATAIALLPMPAVNAQAVEYIVTDIPPAPDAWLTSPEGINNRGEVVGSGRFTFSPSTPFFMRAWKWTVRDGLTLLPPPPGSNANRYGARDISDTGIIVGDGGDDGGLGWRFAEGAYTIVGPLPGDPISQGFGVNDAGDVAGASGNASAPGFDHAFVFNDVIGIVELTPGMGSAALDINNVGQVAGWASPESFIIEAFRFTPGVGIEFLGFPSGTSTTRGFAMNAEGDVVGEAFVNNNISHAFLYTDTGGMQSLPPATNARNQATGVNIHRQVVGNGFEGPIMGWVWTAQTGTRNLSDLVDPALHLTILRALGINDRGQIIATGIDLDPLDPSRRLVLTPIVTGDQDGDSDVDLADIGGFQSCYTGPDATEIPPACYAFDFDVDFDVDFTDFGALQRVFTGP